MAPDARIHLHHSESLEPLLDALAEVLRVPPADPFVPEVVVVPTVGMADATMAGLGYRLGICTNVEFLYPGRFLSRALTPAGAGVAGHDTPDPWRLPQLAWAVLQALSTDSSGVPGVEANGVTWPLARHIADLFDRYATQRPQLIRDWAANLTKAQPVDTDGAGGVLDTDQRWQPQLWRRVRELIGTPSGPELLPHLAARIERGEVEPQLPSRFFVFGVAALQPTLLAVLEGLAPLHEIHIFLEHPSTTLWQRTPPVPTNEHSESQRVVSAQHPLLTSWGRPSLAAHALLRNNPSFAQHPYPGTSAPTSTLLGALQHAIRTDDAGLASPVPRLTDGSLQIHACHGVTRQLEVLRDVLGHCFLADPTLQPHEVIVLCPDLETFAPLIPAVFSRGSLPVPVRVGDRSLAVAEPVVQALLGLARLVVGRATLSGVVDLLQLQPVRQRFGIDHDDVEKITEWCLELGTRWGLDPAHRAHAGLPRTIVNGTWRATVDQLLAGVTMSAPSPRLVLGDTLPYDDLSTDEATVVGALADLLQLLLRVRDLMEDPSTSTLTQRTVHEWCDELHDIIDDLVALPSDQGWRIGQLHQAISALAEGAHVNAAPCAVTFTFPQLLTILESSLSDRAGRVSLRSGAVTVTSMVPQHGVPARVICILGLDDAVLRSGSFDGDDILGHQPCLGERQPRAEQRQVLLDALLDASDRFIITCNGADLTTNAPVPLVVPIAELLDSVELLTGASLRSTDPTHRGAPVVVHHTRHPFDEATFVPGRLTTAFSEPFGFDTSMLGAAVARRSALPAASRSDGTSLSLPVVTRSTLTLDDLIAAITSPAKVLLRERLQVRLPDDDLATIDDAIPLSVDRLTQAQLGGELLDTARHGGPSIDRATVAATHTDLPPGALAHAAIDSVATEVGAIITANQRVAGNETGTHTDLFIDLVVEPESHHTFAVHTQLFGAVSDIAHHSVEPHRSAIRVARFTKMRPSLRLGLGIQLAAATLTDPDRVWDASLVCRADSGDSNDTAATAVLRLIGETRDERCEAARTLLAMATEMAHQSFNTLVPYLDRCSNAVATKMSVSAIEKAFKRDTEYDPYAKRFWSTTDHRDFERLTITTATSVWDTYAKCVSEVLS